MGPKKPKKTKAELEEEKLIREEEERKQRIADEKRQAEENEKKRLEELRIKLEHKLQRQAELSRLQEEFAAIEEDVKDKLQQLSAEQKREKLQLDWIKYKNPTDDFDPATEVGMNTFITLTKEMQVVTIKDAIQMIVRVENVADAVMDLWSESIAKRDVELQMLTLDNLKVLRDMMLDKMDIATVNYLRFIDKELNDKVEANVEEVANVFAVGMWANFNDLRPIRKSIVFDKLGIQLDLAKQVLQDPKRFVYRMMRLPIVAYNLEPYLPISAQSPSYVTRNKYVVGDIMIFDILIAPPSPFFLRAKKWNMWDKSTASTSLTKSQYPSSVKSTMFIKIPANVVYTEDLRVAIWSTEQNDWVEDGIAEFQYNEVTKSVQFYVTTVGIFAFVKPPVSEMPFRKWSLAPISEKIDEKQLSMPVNQSIKEVVIDDMNNLIMRRGNNIYPPLFECQARFSITTQSHEVVIDIVVSRVRLMKPDSSVFKDLVGVFMTPGCLLSKLQKRGINLMTVKEDVESLEGKTSKDLSLEFQVLNEIANGASSFDVHSSNHWNSELDSSRIGLFIRESTAYTALTETYDYECALAELDTVSLSYTSTPELGLCPGSGIKYTLVFGNEYQTKKEYSLDPRPNEVTHLQLSKTMMNRSTPEAMERNNSINQRFKDTVLTLLLLIRPYSFG